MYLYNLAQQIGAFTFLKYLGDARYTLKAKGAAGWEPELQELQGGPLGLWGPPALSALPALSAPLAPPGFGAGPGIGSSNIYIYIYIHIHTQICVFIYVCILHYLLSYVLHCAIVCYIMLYCAVLFYVRMYVCMHPLNSEGCLKASKSQTLNLANSKLINAPPPPPQTPSLKSSSP